MLAPMPMPMLALLPLIGLATPTAALPPAPEPPIPQTVTVTAPKDVKLAATYPANGATVPGGMVMVKVVFDQAMAADGWSYTPAPGSAFPACLARPRLLADARTFVLLCSLPIKSEFAFQIDGGPGFETTGGRRPSPYTVTFKTSEVQTVGIHDALDLAGLPDDANPIMGEVAGGVSVQATAARPQP